MTAFAWDKVCTRLAWGAGLTLFAVVTAVPLESSAQLVLALILLTAMWALTHSAGETASRWLRILVLLIGAYLSLRYLAWRGIYTLSGMEWAVWALALALYGAEIYSTAIHLLGCMVNVAPLRRPALTLADLPPETPLPTVDVMVPSYNEDPSLLEITLRATLQMRYPKEKFTVHLLDDGGTDEKVCADDPRVSAAAKERRRTLRALCRRLGVRYITRPRNESAKAGNINHALGRTDGELVVVLDADHVPTVDFLDRTVPWMVRDQRVFLVQTPHFMINPDPIDRNLLRSFRRMPSEGDMFFQTIQRGLDFWSASFFCGSAAVLRRTCLEEVGGVRGDSITEDAETSLELHGRGYRSVYVNHPLVAGLAPETFNAFVTQRMRWAQGMIQILLLKKPYRAPGLRWHQRLGYMSTILFWLFPFARTVFLLAPLAYLVFGAHIYNASLAQIAAYTIPHLIATYMISSLLFGRTRWPLVSELYELMQSIFSLIAITKVFVNPRRPSFVVTPKGDTLDRDFVSPLYKPFYLLFGLMLLGFAFGFYRLADEPLTRELTIVVLAWNLFNFITVVAALGALYERRQKRASPRIPVNETGHLAPAGGDGLDCEIADLSSMGCRLVVKGAVSLSPGDPAELRAEAPALGRPIHLPAEVRAIAPRPYGTELGIRFTPRTEAHRDDAVAFAYGDSRRWDFFQRRRLRPMPFGRAARLVLGLIWHPVLLMVRFHIAKARSLRGARPVQERMKESPHVSISRG